MPQLTEGQIEAIDKLSPLTQAFSQLAWERMRRGETYLIYSFKAGSKW